LVVEIFPSSTEPHTETFYLLASSRFVSGKFKGKNLPKIVATLNELPTKRMSKVVNRDFVPRSPVLSGFQFFRPDSTF